MAPEATTGGPSARTAVLPAAKDSESGSGRQSRNSGRPVSVSNAELLTVRDAMRDLNRMVDRLERGEAEKYVLTKHGQMRAVVLSVESFSVLAGGSS